MRRLSKEQIRLSYTQKELYEAILQVASGKLEYDGLLNWILQHQD